MPVDAATDVDRHRPRGRSPRGAPARRDPGLGGGAVRARHRLRHRLRRRGLRARRPHRPPPAAHRHLHPRHRPALPRDLRAVAQARSDATASPSAPCARSSALDEQAARHGDALWEREPDRCCALRKVAPLRRRLRGFDAWITAIRRDQTRGPRDEPRSSSTTRSFGLVKVNPLVGWTSAGRLGVPAASTTCPTTRCTSRATRASAAGPARARSRRARTRAPAAGAAASRPSAACTRGRAAATFPLHEDQRSSRTMSTLADAVTTVRRRSPRRTPRRHARRPLRRRPPRPRRFRRPRRGAAPAHPRRARAGRPRADRHRRRQPAHRASWLGRLRERARRPAPGRRHGLAAALHAGRDRRDRARSSSPARPPRSHDAKGRLWGAIEVEEIFERDPVAEARAVYGTEDPAHPGVAYLLGAAALAGRRAGAACCRCPRTSRSRSTASRRARCAPRSPSAAGARWPASRPATRSTAPTSTSPSSRSRSPTAWSSTRWSARPRTTTCRPPCASRPTRRWSRTTTRPSARSSPRSRRPCATPARARPSSTRSCARTTASPSSSSAATTRAWASTTAPTRRSRSSTASRRTSSASRR